MVILRGENYIRFNLKEIRSITVNLVISYAFNMPPILLH